MTKKLKITLFGCALLFALNVAAATLYMHHSARQFAPFRDCNSSPERPASAAVVLFGDRDESTIARVETAVRLLQRGCVQKLMMVGGYRPKKGFHGARWMMHLAEEFGVSQNKLNHGSGSYDTRSNLVEAFAQAQRDHLHELVFVSDPIHLTRIMYLAEQKARKSNIEISLRAVASDYGSSSLLYRWRRFNTEMLAFLFYAILPDKTLSQLLLALRQ